MPSGARQTREPALSRTTGISGEDGNSARVECGNPEVIGPTKPPHTQAMFWRTKAPITMPDEFKGVQPWHQIRQIEDLIGVITRFRPALQRYEPVAFRYADMVD